MKKLIFLTVIVSVVTLTGFLGARKMCQTMNCPMKMSKEAGQICAKVCAGRMEVLQLLKDPQATPQSIDEKVEEVGRLQTSLEKKIVRHILEVKTRLTPEQSQAYLRRIEKELEKTMHFSDAQ